MGSLQSRPFASKIARAVLALVPALLFASALTSTASDDESLEACTAKPYVVSIHADWCGTCKKLQQTWTQIETELGPRSTVVKLDVSNRVALQRSQAEAERLGIDEFFRAYRSRTGTIVVLDGKSHEPVAVLSGEPDFAKYQQAVAEACHPS